METIQNSKTTPDFNQLVAGLQKEDSRNLKMTKNYTTIMWVLAPLYFLLALVGLIVDEPSLDQLGFLFFSLGFLVFGFLFRSLHREYESVDYGIPTTMMLLNASNRYKLWQTKTAPAELISW